MRRYMITAISTAILTILALVMMVISIRNDENITHTDWAVVFLAAAMLVRPYGRRR